MQRLGSHQRTVVAGLLLLLTILLTPPVHAQSPEEQAEAFFVSLEAGKLEEAFDQLFSRAHSRLRGNKEGCMKLIDMTENAFTSAGAPLGHALVRTSKAGENLMVHQYLVRTPVGPLSFSLTFYRADQAYLLIFLDMTAEMDDMYRSAGQAAETSGVPAEVTDAFFKDLLAGKAEEAYTRLLAKGTEKLRAQSAAATTLVAATQKAVGLYGSPTGVERVRTVTVGDDLVREMFVLRCPDHPLFFYVEWYRAQDRYEVISTYFDDKIEPALAR